MKLSLIPLKDWISSNCGNVPSVEQKEEAAFILNVGVATIYRWLKSGDVYIEDLGSDDCGGSLMIWKKEKWWKHESTSNE